MLRWVSSRIHGRSELFPLIPGWHIWHPSVFPEPASNKHAKPFKSITPPTGDAFIVADIPARRSFWFTSVRGSKRPTRSSGFTLLRRHFKKWDRGEDARWSEQALKIAWDDPDSAACKMHAEGATNTGHGKRRDVEIGGEIINTCVARARLHTQATTIG